MGTTEKVGCDFLDQSEDVLDDNDQNKRNLNLKCGAPPHAPNSMKSQWIVLGEQPSRPFKTGETPVPPV